MRGGIGQPNTEKKLDNSVDKGWHSEKAFFLPVYYFSVFLLQLNLFPLFDRATYTLDTGLTLTLAGTADSHCQNSTAGARAAQLEEENWFQAASVFVILPSGKSDSFGQAPLVAMPNSPS